MSILQSSQLIQMVAAVSPAGMLIVDAAGEILYANPQALAWLGYSESELTGQSVEILIPNVARMRHREHRARFAEEPKARAMAQAQDLFAQRKDGSEFPVDISLHPFEIDGQRYVLANILDATERRVAARVPQERLNAIGEMVAGLAHESRNALQRARASLDLLELDLAEEPDQAVLLERIRRSLEELEHNYDEVRYYAAPIVLDACEVDVANLVHEVLADLQSEFDVAEVTIETATGAANNVVDRLRLKQVIRNCLENAIQASKTTNGPILVKIHKDEQWQLLEFRDRGEGLSAEVRERMFEPFFTTKQKGTGLGLAICWRIIEAHEGTIHAEPNGADSNGADSNGDQGTLVTVRLPLRG